MLKILIADDEKLIREDLRMIIDEMKGDIYNVVAEAKDGEDAVNLIEVHHPDIVFSDIRMPKINGLDMIYSISNKYPEIKFIIVSGYSDFEYLKNSIKLGVKDYILKPFIDKEVMDVLKKVTKEVLEENKSKKLFDDIGEENINLKLSSNINQLLLNKDKEKANEIRNLIRLQFFTLTVIQSYGQQNRLIELSHKISTEYIIVFNSQFRDSEIIILSPAKSEIISSRNAVVFAENILDECDKYGITANGGVSRTYDTYIDLQDAYTECIDAVTYRFWQKNNKLYRYRNNTFLMPKWNLINSEMDLLKEIVNNAKTINKSKFIKECQNNISYIFSIEVLGNMSNSDIKKLISRIYFIIITICSSEKDIQEYNGIYSGVASGEIVNSSYTRDIIVNRICKMLIDIYENTFQDNNSNNISRIKKYIEEHFNEDIYLENIGAKFFLDPKYVSRAFKKEYRKTFIEYLTDIRINKAKGLLINTDLGIHEIAIFSGYKDHQYFHRVFKNKVGITPSEYRQNNGISHN